MLPKWCSAVRPGAVGRRRAWRWARLSAITLVVDEVVHPIRRHYTPSDRVQRDGSGVVRRNGCSAARLGAIGRRRAWRWARLSALKLVTDEVVHPIGKIQPLLIGLNLP